MSTLSTRNEANQKVLTRESRKFVKLVNDKNVPLKAAELFGLHTFDIKTEKTIPNALRKEVLAVVNSNQKLKNESAKEIADLVLQWATEKGATHFCHWFQPLTGGTAEKHDAFISVTKDGKIIEKLGASELMQGEPDASSFPNGGSRSTFEARGYTTWDLTSPLFLVEGVNGKTLCIPTAFVSYTGDALDIKTPLLRSISVISKAATEFLNLADKKDATRVHVNIGCEQEYFLVDKAFYFSRPDLVMTGRTLFGSMTAKNQQLDDHYFGLIPERVISFMEELDYELYLVGIPAKTRHNEVAPGQFEIAPIFSDSNVASDNNQVLMATIKKVAERHNFMALLHEKPFAGINGSGKHVNWSLGDNTGHNLLSPGPTPHENVRFLAVVAVVVKAVKKHSKALRMAIASAGNDHRLGANEAPPSIISVFLGDTIEKIYDSILNDKAFSPDNNLNLDLGASQLANLLKDNTDRNRTSPFAFTGNKFEFRAVGSGQAIGFPVSILNAAVAEIFNEANTFLKAEFKQGIKVDDALAKLTKNLMQESIDVVFNGDGYGQEWVEEAQKRGLPNLKTTADSLTVLTNEADMSFLVELGIFSKAELNMRYNVLLERYITLREIEFSTQTALVRKNIIPSALEYKKELGLIIKNQKDIGLPSTVEIELYKKVNFALESLYSAKSNMKSRINEIKSKSEIEQANDFAKEILPISETIAAHCNELEELVPNNLWSLPTYYDMLFLR